MTKGILKLFGRKVEFDEATSLINAVLKTVWKREERQTVSNVAMWGIMCALYQRKLDNRIATSQ